MNIVLGTKAFNSDTTRTAKTISDTEITDLKQIIVKRSGDRNDRWAIRKVRV